MLTAPATEAPTQTAAASPQIYLTKPAGHREGPFSLEQIRQELAAQNYSDTDYWAWYEGLTEWVPLHSLPGIAAPPAPSARWAGRQVRVNLPAPAETASNPAPKPAVPEPGSPPDAGLADTLPPPAQTTDITADTPAIEPQEEIAPITTRVASGMPASALDQVFMFATGNGPTLWHSPKVIRMMENIIGKPLSALRENVTRDVVSGCNIGGLLRPDGFISDAVWYSMSTRRPELIRAARDRLYRVCVRTFRVEADAVVAVVLFYNKARL